MQSTVNRWLHAGCQFYLQNYCLSAIWKNVYIQRRNADFGLLSSVSSNVSGCQPVFKFTHRSKIIIFAAQGRPVAPIQVKFGTTKGNIGPLGHAKFHAIRCPGVGMRPQNGKNFHFLVKSRPTGANPFTDFYC